MTQPPPSDKSASSPLPQNLDYRANDLLRSKPNAMVESVNPTQPGPQQELQATQRCGLIAIIGRPNMGKSTLLNALVGQKISITSRKQQTTRHRITGIYTQSDDTGGGTQFVFVDTPGFQTHYMSALNRSLNKTVIAALDGVDLILLVVQAGAFTPDDEKVLELLAPNACVILVANKLDLINHRSELAPWLQEMQSRFGFAQYVPMSAKNADHVKRLLSICSPYLPEQPWWFDSDTLTDKNEKFLASEVIREKIFRLTGDELPYSSTVVIDQFDEQPSPRYDRFLSIAATIIVARDSHKAMVIGHDGQRLKRIGSEARLDLEKLLGAKVYLQLWVKVRSGWADDEARVRSFGY